MLHSVTEQQTEPVQLMGETGRVPRKTVAKKRRTEPTWGTRLWGKDFNDIAAWAEKNARGNAKNIRSQVRREHEIYVLVMQKTGGVDDLGIVKKLLGYSE